MNRQTRCLLAGVILALAAATTGRAQPPKGGAAPPPPPVKVESARLEQVSDQRTFVGTVRPIRRSVVGSAAPGRVEKFNVNEGDYIEKGQPIASLRRGIIQAELDVAKGQLAVREAELGELVESLQDEIEQAQARLEIAKAQWLFRSAKLERARALGTSIARELLEEDNAAAVQAAGQYREADAALRLLKGPAREQKTNVARGWVAAQKAEVERLSEQLDRHTMFAPFDGYITAEHTEVGQWVMQGDPVAEVVELSLVDIEISVLEDFVRFLNASERYGVEIPALPGEAFEGEIALIVPQADARARTFPVKVRVENRMVNNQPLIKSGMLARVTLPTSPRLERLMVPKDALVLGGPLPVVYVAPAAGSRGPVKAVPVKTGPAEGLWIAVEGAVQVGDAVVIEGNERIRPGMEVRSEGKPVNYPGP